MLQRLPFIKVLDAHPLNFHRAQCEKVPSYHYAVLFFVLYVIPIQAHNVNY